MAMGYDADLLHKSNDITHIVETQEIATGDFTARVREPTMEAEDIIRRMRQVYGVKTDTALANELNLAISAPSNWRQRNSPPYAICVDIALKKGISLDWLILGIGDMQSSNAAGVSTEAEHLNSQPGPDPVAERLSQFVNWWSVSRTRDEMIWLEQQFKRAVPEYGEWLTSTPLTL
jgi:hypothetical protein